MTLYSGNRLASEPAIRAQPNAHRLRNLRTKAAPPRTFTNPDNMIEMIRRGNGFRDLASKQAVEHAITAGRGNVDLLLTSEQYERLVGYTHGKDSRWIVSLGPLRFGVNFCR